MLSMTVLTKTISDNNPIYQTRLQKRSSAISQLLKKCYYTKTHLEFTFNDFEFSIATTKKEMQDCFSLAYLEYFKKAYVKENTEQPMIINPYDLEKGTMIVMVKDKVGDLIGTLTIILDSKKSLPSDELFQAEIDSLRTKKSGVAEIVRLAVREDYKNSKEILVGMFNLVNNFTYVYNCQYLTIEVNPRHVKYYERLLWFQAVSAEKQCTRVGGAPAILLVLDIHHVPERSKIDTIAYKKSLFPSFENERNGININHLIFSSMQSITAEERQQACTTNADVVLL